MTIKRTTSKEQNKLFRIAIYLRVSTEEQAENPEGSIKNQEQRIREFIKLKNMVEPFGEVSAVFSDPGVSAKDMNRPGFQKMLAAIQSREVNLVLVTELSRFSRSTKDFTALQEFLEENNCKFLSMRENFDTSGAAGSMVMNLMASIAEFERRQTAERISNSFLARSKRGLYNGGSLPLGYRIHESKPGHLFIDPAEAEIVKLAFQVFFKQGTLASTAKFLTASNVRLPKKVHGSGAVRESQFTVDSLYRLLKNKSYIGIRVYQTKHGVEEVPAVWEPIIDVDTFERAGRLLTKNCHHKRTHGTNRFPYTLSGIILCEQCGERMSGKSAHGRGGKVGYYEHTKTARLQSGNPEKLKIHNPHRVPSAKLEPMVWKEVKRFVLSDAFAEDLLARARLMQEAKNHIDEVGKLRQKVKITEGQIEVLAERIATLPKEMDLSPLIDQLSKLQKSKIDFEEATRSMETKTPEQDSPVSFENLAIFRNGLRRLIEKGEKDKNVQTSIIKKVVHKITIKPDGFEIHFHVGNTYYLREPGANAPGSCIFLFHSHKINVAGTRKSAKGQVSEFFKGHGSSLLTIGEPRLPINELLQAIDFTEFIVKISKRISAEDKQNVAEMYSKGMSLRDISNQLGMSKNAVRSSLLRAGQKLREPTPKVTHMRSLKSGKQAALPYYGFCYFEGKIVKDPREFPTLQRIHRLWSQGRTIHQINLELNRAKLPSRTGKIWSWAAIQNIVARFENKQVILTKGGKYEFR